MCPSLLKRNEYTACECPFNSVNNVPSAKSQTRMRLSTPETKCTTIWKFTPRQCYRSSKNIPHQEALERAKKVGSCRPGSIRGVPTCAWTPGSQLGSLPSNECYNKFHAQQTFVWMFIAPQWLQQCQINRHLDSSFYFILFFWLIWKLISDQPSMKKQHSKA